MEKVNCTNCGTDNSTKSKYCYNCGYELPKIEIPHIENSALLLEPEPTKKKNKKLALVVGIIAVVLAYIVVHFLFFSSPPFEKMMKTAAIKLNKTCPRMIDKYSRLDNVVVLSNNAFQYNYTLVNINKSEVNLDSVKKNVIPAIVQNVKINPDLKVYRDHKTTMIYCYHDKKGLFILKFPVTPAMYK